MMSVFKLTLTNVQSLKSNKKFFSKEIFNLRAFFFHSQLCASLFDRLRNAQLERQFIFFVSYPSDHE